MQIYNLHTNYTYFSGAYIGLYMLTGPFRISFIVLFLITNYHQLTHLFTRVFQTNDLRPES